MPRSLYFFSAVHSPPAKVADNLIEVMDYLHLLIGFTS